MDTWGLITYCSETRAVMGEAEQRPKGSVVAVWEDFLEELMLDGILQVSWKGGHSRQVTRGAGEGGQGCQWEPLVKSISAQVVGSSGSNG